MFQLVFKYRRPDFVAKPLFHASVNNYKSLCLFDTGADLAVINSDMYSYLRPRLNYLGDNNISGFGGLGFKAKIYSVNSLVVSDGCNCVVLRNFPVAYISGFESIYDLILGYSFCRHGVSILDPDKNSIKFMFSSNQYVYRYKNDGTTDVYNQGVIC